MGRSAGPSCDDDAVSKPSEPHPNARRSGNPAKRASAAGAPRSRPTRSRSYAVLSWLTAQPKLLVPVATVALVLGGLFLPRAIGALCLLVVAAFLGWLGYLSWSRLSAPARLWRVLVVGLISGVAIARFTGNWTA